MLLDHMSESGVSIRDACDGGGQTLHTEEVRFKPMHVGVVRQQPFFLSHRISLDIIFAAR